MAYKRRSVTKAIILALRELGGSASRKDIRKTMGNDELDGLTYADVYSTIKTKKGGYSPFLFDFNFGLKELEIINYVEPLQRGLDVSLTELGRTADLRNFPSKEEKDKISNYWKQTNALRIKRKANTVSKTDSKVELPNDEVVQQDSTEEQWKVTLLEQIKNFSPAKFESFSRLLISKMGVKIDKHKGVQLSGDHGIDGFGYYVSDEFRTSRVAIQCKRYTHGLVGEAEVRDFKGTMDSFNAEYGIFVTTSSFTNNAAKVAMQGTRTVTLIDGQELCDLVEEYQLRIHPVTTYELDDYYYEKD